MKQPIYIGADHAGFKLKEEIKRYFDGKKIKYIDVGNQQLDSADDYPDFGIKLAESVAKNKSIGVLVCGSSMGVCIVANKKKGIRAVSVANVRDAKLSREHNDANVICLSGWNLPAAGAKKIVMEFLKTKASTHPRHLRRIKKISTYEKKNFK